MKKNKDVVPKEKKPKAIHRCEQCEAVLPVKRKYCGERCKQIEFCKSMGTTKYLRGYVAGDFQKMIRAEAGAEPAGFAKCVEAGDIFSKYRQVGQCVCVTCGKVDAWDSGIKGIHTGHFLGSRCNSILLEEDNTAPQCSHDNFYRSGAPQEFRLWMLATRGIEVIERLERLKRTSVSFTRDQLVDLRMSYKARLDAAIAKMKNGG